MPATSAQEYLFVFVSHFSGVASNAMIKKMRVVHFSHIDQNLLVIRRVGAKPDSPISAQRAENITPYIAYFS